MKDLIKNTFIVLLLCIAGNVFSQAVVSVERNNYIYAGVENPLSIAIPGVSENNVYVSCEDGTIKNINGINYTLIANNRTAILQVFEIKKNDTVFIEKYELRVIQIAAPDIYISGNNISGKDAIINKNILRTNPNIYLKYPDQVEGLIKNAHLILSFNLNYTKDGIPVTKTIQGNKIPNEIIQLMITLPEGTQFQISEIKIQTPFNGVTMLGNSEKFIIN